LDIALWSEQGDGHPAEVHFVIRNGSQYYISEASFDPKSVGPDMGASGQPFKLADFNNSSTPGKRWASINPTSADFDLPADPHWAAVNFDNVTEIGWLGTGTGAYTRLFGFDHFDATATVKKAGAR
jgi:hypothetical protein